MSTGKFGKEKKNYAPLGNTNGLTHGIYANRFLSDEEKPLFESIIAKLYQDFPAFE